VHAVLILVVWALSADFKDERFADAVGSLVVTDTLRAQCPSAGAAPLAPRLADWERENRIADLRAAIANARKAPGGEDQYRKLQSSTAMLAPAVFGRGCEGLDKWLSRPEAKLAGSFDGGARPAPAAAPTGRPAPAAVSTAVSSPAAPAPAAPAITGDVLGYGLIQTYGSGYGGMVTVKFTPVVLFRSGEILTDMKGMTAPGGLAADRRANPGRWSKWRQQGGVYQYQNRSGEWRPVNGNKVWTTPPNANLSGKYVSTGGGGNLSVGGSDAVFVERSYTFQPGGRVTLGGFSSASSSFEGGGSRSSTVTNARRPAKTGRYTVSGLTMTIAYDDGGSDQVLLMTYPTDPDIIWINGEAYTKD